VQAKRRVAGAVLINHRKKNLKTKKKTIRKDAMKEKQCTLLEAAMLIERIVENFVYAFKY
jgi:hypothetical protein